MHRRDAGPTADARLRGLANKPILIRGLEIPNQVVRSAHATAMPSRDLYNTLSGSGIDVKFVGEADSAWDLARSMAGLPDVTVPPKCEMIERTK